MYFQRLDRDSTMNVINGVKSSAHPGLFSAGTSEVRRAYLSFYSGLFLYKLTNFSSLPSFSFEFVGNGTFFHYLDGTEEPIYTLNDEGYLVLNDRSVLDYLDFFLSHTAEDGGESFLIRNPEDMPLLDSLDMKSAEAIAMNHRPAFVEYDAGFDKFTLETDLYAEGLVMRAVVCIDNRGRVDILERKMVLNAVAETPHSEIIV